MDRNKRWKLTEAERKTVEVWKRFIVILLLITEIIFYFAETGIFIIPIKLCRETYFSPGSQAELERRR